VGSRGEEVGERLGLAEGGGVTIFCLIVGMKLGLSVGMRLGLSVGGRM